MGIPTKISKGISIHALCEEGDPNKPRKHGRATISIHALCEEGDRQAFQVQKYYEISIHALCEEGDAANAGVCYDLADFYPRPLRGGRQISTTLSLQIWEFLSTPSARRATTYDGQQYTVKQISIHALCEEGDGRTSARCTHTSDFYPRPLRGGRPNAGSYNASFTPFLSTPSARRATRHPQHKCWLAQISIHALCEEGDKAGR